MAAQSACSPNGSRFNLESLTNAVGQFDERVAVLPGSGIGGADLVVGTALDTRALPPVGFVGDIMADAMYVQRDSSDCGADLEGELPFISSALGNFQIFGHPIVVADPAHGAFFIADLRYGGTAGEAIGLIKTTPAILNNTSKCPSGTLSNTVPCLSPVAQLPNFCPINGCSPFDVSIAVDQRTAATGAGDVYVASAQFTGSNSQSNIVLSACPNTLLSCSASIPISGSDNLASAPWVAVRPDGGITVSYANALKISTGSPFEIRFVNCTPAGAPSVPVCSAPTTVLTENQPAGVPGEIQLVPQSVNPLFLFASDPTIPKHLHRMESGGSTTTFLVYDRCDTPDFNASSASLFPLCPKTDVVVTSSTDSGATWSPIQNVSNADGQQLFGNLALDDSTGTVNIAYYSSENDALKTSVQVFLAQIPPGETTVSPPQQVTSALYGGSLGGFNNTEGLAGSYLGVAAGGTGKAGQSVVYIHFTGSVVNGQYAGAPFPVTNNILTSFHY